MKIYGKDKDSFLSYWDKNGKLAYAKVSMDLSNEVDIEIEDIVNSLKKSFGEFDKKTE